MTTTKSYDLLNRLTSIVSVPGGIGAAPVSFAYKEAISWHWVAGSPHSFVIGN